MHEESGLIVRRHARRDLVLPASISIAPEHQAMVRFSSNICERDGWVRATLTDFSPGGIGLMTHVYVPRMAVLRVRVRELADDEGSPILDIKARVQRVIMTDRRPAYLIGTSFVDVTDEQRAIIHRIAARMDDQDSN
ncbi:MAG: PilZ domain-containing protein [Phycisphaeraceae bacterium]|nr:PilZ domain-containing protein [Phycisphaeraceae bacterium]MCW5762462.1 PilZ domain-containing protein [Phycisphaeraceae bacterium]